MDRIGFPEKLKAFFQKYKYVLLVLALGVFLMTLPEKTESPQPQPEVETSVPDKSVEESLEEILRLIEGVGNTEVLLTESRGGERSYQTDIDTQTSDAGGSQRVETVIVSDSDRGQSGLLRQQNPPEYRGAIVVCQGGDRPEIQLAVITAVSNVTGIRSDRITVLKMK